MSATTATTEAEETLSPDVKNLLCIFGGNSTNKNLVSAVEFVLEAHDNNVERAADYLLREPNGIHGVVHNLRQLGYEDIINSTSNSLRRRGDHENGYDVVVGNGGLDGDRNNGGSGRDVVVEEGGGFMYLNERELNVLVGNIKEIVVPGLRGHIEGMRIEEVREDGEKFGYFVGGMCCEYFGLEERFVRVNIVENGMVVEVSVSDVDVRVRVGEWRYTRKKIPRVSDEGDGVVSVNGVEVGIRVVGLMGSNESGGDVGGGLPAVEHCTVKVKGDLKLRVGKSRLAVIYNALATVLQPVLRNRLERAVEDTIRRTLEGQIQEWTSWVMQ